MNTTNQDSKPIDNMESHKPDVSACGAGCGCHAVKPAGKTRWIVGLVVLVAAGVLVARAVVKDNSASVAPASTGFAALPVSEKTSATGVAVAATDMATPKEIAAFSELNILATDMTGVFVILPGKSDATGKAPTAQILAAVRTMEPQLNGGKIGMFMLKAGSADYTQVASQVAVPGVIAMVKGGGMAPVTGEITEAKLVQAFVGASSAGGCGPSSGGCGPSSGGCK